MPAQEQKALILEKKQGDFVMSTLPIPKPGKDEVLLKVISSALNPVDWRIQKYGWWIEDYPSVFGTDIAGEVVELGEGVSSVDVGDKVIVQGSYGQNEYNGFQQYALADIHTLAKIPSNVSTDEAATIPVALTAAYVALYNVKPHGLGFETPVHAGARGKYQSTPIVILGGASSLGQYAIQLAALSGFGPIITTASPKHEEYLESLGATVVVDRHIPATQEAFYRFSEKPIGVVLDAISSAETHKDALKILGSGGLLASVLALEDHIKSQAEQQNTEAFHILGLKTLPFHVQLLREFWAHATELLQNGDIKSNKVEVLPNGLKGIPEGLERLYENKVSGGEAGCSPARNSLGSH